MSGRHDRAGDEIGARLLVTGPILVRGLSRGMRDVMQSGRSSRHRDDEGGEDQSGTLAAVALPMRADGAAESTRARMMGSGDDDSVRARGEQDVHRSADVPDDHDGPRLRAGDMTQNLGRESGAGGGGPRRPRGGRVGRELGGIAVLVVLALVCAGLVATIVTKTRSDAARTAQEAASYTPPPIASASPSSTARPLVVFITDETATRAAGGVTVAQRWPRLVTADLSADLKTIAVTGAGFSTAGARDRTFVDAAEDVPEDADVVVFVGGAADLGTSSLTIARAATRAFAAANERAPDAAVVAVGPLFQPSGSTEADVDTMTTALASSARIADADWVNPISALWVPDVEGVTGLDQQAENRIASRMSAVLEEALD